MAVKTMNRRRSATPGRGTGALKPWLLKLPPELYADMVKSAEKEGFTNLNEWGRVQLRMSVRRVLGKRTGTEG